MSHPHRDLDGRLFSPRYVSWLLTLLVAVYACAFIDRIIVAVIGPALSRDLGLSDFEFGLLGGMAFALFFSTLGLPIAWIAERRARTRLIAISVAVWSALTMLCGITQTYWQLLLCRLGVGVGEAGCTPPAHSLISDHVPPERRASALSIYSIGVPIGATIGAAGGGWIAQTFDWRTAFIAVGAPGLLLAVLCWVTLREPPRGRFDGGDLAAPPLATTLKRLLASRTFVHITVGASLVTLAANGIGLFAPSYFVRAFELGLGEVGLLYGLTTGAAGIAGMLAGGFGADLAVRRDPRWYVWMPAVAAAAAVPLYVAAYTQPALLPAMACTFAAVGVMSAYFAPTFGLAQNLVEPRMRASASAVILLVMNIVGQGIGPMLMGLASDAFAASAFAGGDYVQTCRTGGPVPAMAAACREASVAGLRQAIVITTGAFIWGVTHYLLAARSVRQDLARSGR